MRYSKLSAILSASWLMCLPAAHAQEASGEPDATDANSQDIIVTAEKRSTSVQRTPAAVTAIAGDDLLKKGGTRIADLANALPSTRIGQVAGSPALCVRGIGQIVQSSNVSPAVAVIFNGAYVPREIVLSGLYDLASVESLPCPQSTIYESNAIGGIINLNPRRPASTLGFNGSVEIGNYSLIHTQLAVNVPISDTLAIRAAGDTIEHDGYFTNGGGGQADRAGRLGILFKPSENFSIYVVGAASRQGGLPAPYVNSPLTDPSNPWRSDRDISATYQRSRGESISAEIKYDDGKDSVTYIPSYVRGVNDRLIYASLAPDFQFFGLSRVTTHELRYAHQADNGSSLLAGLYYSRIKSDTNSDFFFAPFGNLGIRTINKDNIQESYAAFGQYRLKLNDVFTVNAGGRYSSNKSSGTGARIVRRNNVFLSTGDFGSVSHRWEHFDWKVAVEAQVTPQNFLYANVQTGYLMGGPSLQVLGTPGYNPLVQPQKLTGYTAGSKNRFLDGALQLNLEAYYYDYRDYQVSANVGGITVFYNAPKAEVYGVQFDGVAQFARNSILAVNLGIMRAKYKDFSNATVGNLNGLQLPGSPGLTGTVTYTQGIDVQSIGRFEAQGLVHFESSSWATFNQVPQLRRSPSVRLICNSPISPSTRSCGSLPSYATWATRPTSTPESRVQCQARHRSISAPLGPVVTRHSIIAIISFGRRSTGTRCSSAMSACGSARSSAKSVLEWASRSSMARCRRTTFTCSSRFRRMCRSPTSCAAPRVARRAKSSRSSSTSASATGGNASGSVATSRPLPATSP